MILRIRAAVLATGLMLGAASAANAQTASQPAPAQETVVTTRAAGPFEVRMAPLATDAPVGRMSLDKTYHGDLEGTAQGEFLAAMTPVEGSAGYVAIERVTGTLAGRSGTFMLQHSGTMARGAQSLSITVVPDSGTGELTGLTGTMRIIMDGGKHTYELDYTLPPAS
ncbi:DUF3224 domain-containing protein [Longimicrobium sp.]|uniref:DUF3224 domain-containing protein n=1 Tax=Longimicrobium sp. TaxID=2029185 RepID=UPI002E362485|nr:DUF3224 domain-containing protein [Longimicrobium sp.]HEX6039405.1 DUF3224 domain-containing protein [Longimicrobium sp.]